MSNKTPIRVFTSIEAGDSTDLDLAGELDTYADAAFERGWYYPGEFEININKYMQYAAEFKQERFVCFGPIEKKRHGIITHVERSVAENGKGGEKINIRGRELSFMLDRRLIYPPAGLDRLIINDAIETVIKNAVKSQAGSTAATERQMGILNIVLDQGRGADYLLSARYDNLLAVLQDAALATSAGFAILINPTTKKLDLEVYFGVDRTAGQSVNGRAIFSSNFDTIKTGVQTQDDADYKNLAVVGGQGEGTLRTIRTVFNTTEPQGVFRREVFVDARDLATNPELDQRGAQELANLVYTNFISTEILARSSLILDEGYTLGDFCTVKEFGVSENVQITKILEGWSSGYDAQISYDKIASTITSQLQGFITKVNSINAANEKA